MDEFVLLVYIFQGTGFALPLKSFKLEHFFRDVAARFMKPLLAQGTCCHFVFSCSVREATMTVYFEGDMKLRIIWLSLFEREYSNVTILKRVP